MIQGIQDVYYNVADVKRALLFYTEALQMKLEFQHEGWAALRCGGVKIGLHPTEAGEEMVLVSRDSHGAHGQATRLGATCSCSRTPKAMS